MAIFQSQFANVVEWNETDDDVIFWKWNNQELKKSSRLVIRPGQDAVFLYNGRVEGVFTDEGNFELESDILPFLSTLKGFKFGFNSGLRAEVVFINTKEFLINWGTKNPVLIKADGLPGGLPIRSFGTFTVKVSEAMTLIDKVAGVREQFTTQDILARLMSMLDSLLMKWISREGKDVFNLQSNAREIAAGIKTELDMDFCSLGLSVTSFSVSSFSYPEEIQKKINQAASYQMVGDVDRFQKVAMADAIASGKGGDSSAAGTASSMAGMMMGMQMAKDIINSNESVSKGAKFCSQCGSKLGESSKFCPECGAKL